MGTREDDHRHTTGYRQTERDFPVTVWSSYGSTTPRNPVSDPPNSLPRPLPLGPLSCGTTSQIHLSPNPEALLGLGTPDDSTDSDRKSTRWVVFSGTSLRGKRPTVGTLRPQTEPPGPLLQHRDRDLSSTDPGQVGPVRTTPGIGPRK